MYSLACVDNVYKPTAMKLQLCTTQGGTRLVQQMRQGGTVLLDVGGTSGEMGCGRTGTSGEMGRVAGLVAVERTLGGTGIQVR